VEQLMEKVSAEQLKVELARFGMKCGGTPLDRAKRLWCTRDKPLEQLPAKLFTKKTTNKNGKKSMGVDGDESQYQGGNQRRIDIAKLEMIVSSMLGQLRPTLDATARRAERRLTQTTNEKEKEMEEEVNGAFDDAANKDGEGNSDSDDSDDEEAPIYNPKGVPLGWDGKPIAYWLFKLHGLNHFYPCEICGNESYRGRHNFEKHFAETKHAYGMKCLGMPNTMHFHGVTKIEDAQNLWQKLEENVNKDIFDGSKEEEYEDSQGNVLSRATYEDLARQGLL
jgi:splicing factor 3A subunit 3